MPKGCQRCECPRGGPGAFSRGRENLSHHGRQNQNQDCGDADDARVGEMRENARAPGRGHLSPGHHRIRAIIWRMGGKMRAFQRCPNAGGQRIRPRPQIIGVDGRGRILARDAGHGAASQMPAPGRLGMPSAARESAPGGHAPESKMPAIGQNRRAPPIWARESPGDGIHGPCPGAPRLSRPCRENRPRAIAPPRQICPQRCPDCRAIIRHLILHSPGILAPGPHAQNLSQSRCQNLRPPPVGPHPSEIWHVDCGRIGQSFGQMAPQMRGPPRGGPIGHGHG